MSDFETIIRNPKEFGDRLLDLKNRTMFCDVKISVETEKIPAHKIVLASSSEYFEKIFSDNQSMGDTELKNADLETFQSLLEYCYTGIIRVSMKNLRKIMQLAIFLKITSIIEGCEKILKRITDSSNCILTWKLTKSENLRNVAFECARQNFEKVSHSPEFLDLNNSEVLELLSSDIVVANETIVFESVKKWINHDIGSRKQHLDKLLKYVRFEYLPENILSDVEFQSFCSDNSSTECFNKMLNALRWKGGKKLMSYDENLRDSYNINTLTVVGSQYYNEPKTMEIFDLKNDKWVKVENFECDRNTFSAILLDHKLILIGGESEKYNIINTVQSYDLITGTTENLPPMKYARHRLSAVVFNGRIYAIGGRTYTNSGRDKTDLAYVEMWDPVSQEWKELDPMLKSRNGCEAKVLGEEIFVVGGGNSGNALSDTESYNLITNKWKKCAAMNEKRHAPGVTAIGDYLYVAGGMMSDDVYLNTVEKYDTRIDKWSMVHSLQNINAWMGSGSLFGKFVIVGGSQGGGHNLSTMEMYDNENDNWISMPSLNGPRRMLRAVEIPWPLARAILKRQVPK